MTLRHTLLALTLGLGLSAGLLAPTAANAVGKTCASNKLVERCTNLTVDDRTMYAHGSISPRREGVRMRLVAINLQHRSDGRWRNISSNRPDMPWVTSSASTVAGFDCEFADAGKWRSRSVVQWKLGPRGEVRTGRLTSEPVGRDRLCG